LDTDRNIFDRLQLIRSENIGPASYIQLIRKFGTAADAIKAIPDLAARRGKRSAKIANAHVIHQEIETVRKLGANFLFLDDPDYPRLLRELSNPPPILIWRGHLELLKKPTVAIVGARNSSAAACRYARDLANGLVERGISIVSGLARGIDTAAHQGALEKATIAVIAGGIDVHYPPENEKLQERIAARGLLLAEQPPGIEPRARHFPFRNRIIAGLARGTVVVEAAPKSGSLITARLTAEAGRHVMAVPGSPLDPRSLGCNSLIREGATLVQSVDDVIEMIGHFDDRADPINSKPEISEHDFGAKETSVNQTTGYEESRSLVWSLLSSTPVMVDEIARQSFIAPERLQLLLLEFELAGRIIKHAGGKISRLDN
jgi:DNA processing protein